MERQAFALMSLARRGRRPSQQEGRLHTRRGHRFGSTAPKAVRQGASPPAGASLARAECVRFRCVSLTAVRTMKRPPSLSCQAPSRRPHRLLSFPTRRYPAFASGGSGVRASPRPSAGCDRYRCRASFPAIPAFAGMTGWTDGGAPSSSPRRRGSSHPARVLLWSRGWNWIPACAGMTREVVAVRRSRPDGDAYLHHLRPSQPSSSFPRRRESSGNLSGYRIILRLTPRTKR